MNTNNSTHSAKYSFSFKILKFKSSLVAEGEEMRENVGKAIFYQTLIWLKRENNPNGFKLKFFIILM